MKKLCITACFALLLNANLTAQTFHEWEGLYSQLCDYDDLEDSNLENLYELLCELEANPIDLNNASDDDIRQLTFLNSEQMEGLSEYIDRYKPLRSLGELAMIVPMDPLRLQLLQHFTYVSNEEEKQQFPSIKDILKYGRNEIVATAKIPLYERKGDKNGYLGYKYKHWFRYSFKYGQYLQIGLTGAQDAGEPFFAGGNNLGYDHYAYYAIIRKLGILKTLAMGQYKARFGLGLILNTGFTLGKTTSMVMSMPANYISPNASRSEGNYLHGAATTISIAKHLDATALVSWRKVDATLNDNGSVKTLLKTGYHRTQSEMLRKHNTTQLTTGANLRWRLGGLHIGASGLYTSFNRQLNPNTNQVFRQHYPTGSNFFNASIDYGYLNHRININGETATNDNGAIATLNSISIKASSSLTLSTIQRYYSYKYYSLYSASFSDGGHVQNESGIYLGINWSPIARLSMIAYTDYAYFPWARYGVSTSSHSFDNMLQATYSFSSSLSITTRYRLRIRQEDYTNPTTKLTSLIDKTEHRARVVLAYAGKNYSLKTQADAALTTFPHYAEDKSNSFGWLISQTAGYNISFINLYAGIAYFRTHDYNSRLYVYERGMLYNFSFPMFYGEGMHLSLLLKGNINKNLSLLCKVATTKYFDRDKISNSYQMIDSSHMTDVDLQVKWKF